MMNEITLVSQEEIKGMLPPQESQSSKKKGKEKAPAINRTLPSPQKEVPVNKWIMPPEQQGYIQGNDRDCL